MPEPSTVSASPATERGLFIWAALWFGGFAVSAALAKAGIGFHSSTGAFATLVVRDVVCAGLGFLAWQRLPPGSTVRTAAGRTLDRVCAVAAGALLVAYIAAALQRGPAITGSALIFEELQVRMPLRIVSLVLFQQMVTTWYLLDVARLRFGDTAGLALTVGLFAASHAIAPALGVPVGWSLLLVLLAAAGMTLWGLLRIRYGTRLAPICLHVSFYLVTTLVYAFVVKGS